MTLQTLGAYDHHIQTCFMERRPGKCDTTNGFSAFLAMDIGFSFWLNKTVVSKSNKITLKHLNIGHLKKKKDP